MRLDGLGVNGKNSMAAARGIWMFSVEAQNYEQAKSLFRIDVPEQFNFGFDVIDRHAAEGRKRALVWTDAGGRESREYSFRDISRLSNRAANALRSIGVGKGD